MIRPGMLLTVCAAALVCVVVAQPPRQGGGPPPGGSTTNGVKCGTTADSAAVTVTKEGGFRVVKASGCPGYDWTSQTTPNTAVQTCATYKLPLLPVLNSAVTYVGVYTDRNQTTKVSSVVLGSIGVAANGVAIFGNADADLRDAYVNEGATFDMCKGHAAPGGEYHYHSKPGDRCVYTDTSGAHSPMFGFMADGIPIFGPLGDNGTVPSDLDECNGHVDATHPYYHYHLPNGDVYPYTVNCLRGCLNGTSLSNKAAACTPATKQYDYSALANAWLDKSKTFECSSSTNHATAHPPTTFLTLAIVVASLLPLLLA